MDIPNLKFTQTTFRRGYRQKEVDQFLDLVATDLALPLAARSLSAHEVEQARFHPTMVRTGYDEREVDYVLDELSVQLGQPSPAARQDGPALTDPPDDLRPDPTF